MLNPRSYALRLITAVGLALGATALPALAQTVKTLPQGEMEARFNDGCVVYYDNRGRRTYSRPGCSNSQVKDADKAVARHASQGHGGGSHDNRPPRVVMGSNGKGEVIFPNDCVVYYNRDGTRDGASKACDRDQRRQADDAMARYRREQGYGSGSGGWQNRPPQVVIDSDGRGRVMYRDGCTVNYDRHGNRRDASSRCGRDQKRQADDAMARYRREQGYGGPGGGGGPHAVAPRATILETGYGLVTYSDGCRVTYGVNGERSGFNKKCSREQVVRADDAMARYRREHGNQWKKDK